jgi:basic amino acid/polyamine antiporter, APA family
MHNIKAKLSTFDATMIVVSLVIGIGIFRTPAIVATNAPTPFLFFAAWVLGGFISLLGALTFAEIGSRLPKPGAFYKVVADSYHPAVAFMLNWTNVTIVNGAGSAAVAMIGAEYLTPILLPPHLQTPFATQLTAAGLILFLLAINYLGIKSGAWTQNVLTVIKIGMIVGLVIVAVAFAKHGEVIAPTPTTTTSWWWALGVALISVFYTYGGYQCAINFGGDIKGAERQMPRAIGIGIALIIALYLLINFAYYRVLGIDGIAGSNLVAGEVARFCFGGAGHTIVSIAIFLSAMGFLNVTLMHIPRTYFAMAQDGALPSVFMSVNPRTQAQEFTLLFFGATILLCIFFLGTFERLMNYVMLFDTLNNALVASTLFVLRRRHQDAGSESYRVPFYPVLPAVFILFLIGITVNVIISQPAAVGVGLVIMAAGLPIYLGMRRLTSRRQQPL